MFCLSCFSVIISGPTSDWLVVRLARRNKGIMEPEHRLWIFIANACIVPPALLLWGVGAAHEIHWFGLLVAMFFLAFQSTIGVTVSVAYVVDSYEEMSGDAMCTVIVIRNTMAFAISYGYVFSGLPPLLYYYRRMLIYLFMTGSGHG